MGANTPTHCPGGVNDTLPGDPMNPLAFLDPTRFIRFFEDFIIGASGIPIVSTGLGAAATASTGWVATVTEAGAGNAAITKPDASGGWLVLTNDAADDDAIFLQSRGEAFKWFSNKQLYFETRFKVSDATQSDLVFGLQITDTTPLDVTDGLFFSKADGVATLIFNVEKNNAASTLTTATLASDTFITVAFYYNPETAYFYVYADNVLIGAVATTNAVDDEELSLSFGIQNGEAVAKSLTVDYIFVAQER